MARPALATAARSQRAAVCVARRRDLTPDAGPGPDAQAYRSTSSRRGARNSQPRNTGGRAGSRARFGNRRIRTSIAILTWGAGEGVPGAEVPARAERQVRRPWPEDVKAVRVAEPR